MLDTGRPSPPEFPKKKVWNRSNQETEGKKRRSEQKGCVCVCACVLSDSRNLGSPPVCYSVSGHSPRVPARFVLALPGPAVMNRQNSPAQHKGSGLIIGSLMLSDTRTHSQRPRRTHTHTHTLSRSGSRAHGWTSTLRSGMKK